MIQSSAINFLRNIYGDSVPDMAALLNAQAEDDYETIIWYLRGISLQIEVWVNELNEGSKK